jgi:hypothetical protein
VQEQVFWVWRRGEAEEERVETPSAAGAARKTARAEADAEAEVQTAGEQHTENGSQLDEGSGRMTEQRERIGWLSAAQEGGSAQSVTQQQAGGQGAKRPRGGEEERSRGKRRMGWW